MKKYSNQNLLFIVILIGFIFLMLNYANLNPIKKLIEGNTDNESKSEEVKNLENEIKEILDEVINAEEKGSNTKVSWEAFYTPKRKGYAKTIFKKYAELNLLNMKEINNYQDLLSFIKQDEKTPSDWLKVFEMYRFIAPYVLGVRALKDLGLDLYSEIENIGVMESGGAAGNADKISGEAIQSLIPNFGNNNN